MSSLVDLGIGDAIKGLIGLGGEFIEDKDKRNEFNMRVREMEGNLTLTLIKQKTHPTVDAFVKLLYAMQPFFRPLGSLGMMAFLLYSYTQGIEMDKEIQVILAGAFPLWGASRHVEKNKK